MCRRLIAAGYNMNAFDINESALSEVAKAGAVAATSASACAAQVDLLLTSLPHPQPCPSRHGRHKRGHSRRCSPDRSGLISPPTARTLIIELAGEAPPGVQVVDSPVTGAVDGARNGTLTLFISGEAEPVAKARKVLENLGLVIACGSLGSGNVVKLVTNQLWFISAAALGEGFRYGDGERR